MSVLSIRSLPKEIEKALLKEAKRQGKTKTEIVIGALEEKFQLTPQEQRKKQIRAFFGKMTPKEYQTFKGITQEFESIDEELWK